MMAEATLIKAASLEYYNMLLFFTTPVNQAAHGAQEYLPLLQEELNKLLRRMVDSSAQELKDRLEREVQERAKVAR